MSDGRPWLVGESPSRTGDRFYRFPLSGAPARTLCRAAGWEPDGPADKLGSWTWALYARFRTVNVYPRWADARNWATREARERATALYTQMRDEGAPAAVLLGRRVADAFAVGGAPYFAWSDKGPVPLVVVPHPSGRNRLMNDPDVRDAVGAALRDAVTQNFR